MASGSNRYRGVEGARYARRRFGRDLSLGRAYQSRYFAAYCDIAKVVLDFGCGDGSILHQVQAQRKIGVEVNEESRRRLSKRIPEATITSDLESIDPESVDVVITNHCLEHVPRPLDAVIALWKVLRPGGEAIVVVPFDDWRSRKNRSWVDGDPDFHLYTWSPMNLGNLLKEGGFEVKSVEVITSAWSPQIFWVHRVFGMRAFEAACFALAWLWNRRQILAVAFKPEN